MKKYILSGKILINEIFFGVSGFIISLLVMTLWKYISPEPQLYFWSLFLHIVQIVIIMSVVRNIMKNVPDVFDVSFIRDNTLISATVLLLVDWEKLKSAMESLRN